MLDYGKTGREGPSSKPPGKGSETGTQMFEIIA